MGISFTKFERVVVFCGFILLLAGLVGGAYVLSTNTPAAVAIAATTTTPTPPAATQPAAAPAVTAALPQIVFATDSLEPADEPDWAWQAWASTPATPALPESPKVALTAVPTVATLRAVAMAPAPVVSSAPAAAPVAVAPQIELPAARPAVKAIPPAPPVVAAVEPYTINIASTRVIHMYSAEDGNPPCWYELKLDRSQLDSLRKSVAQISDTDHAELDELDHLSESPKSAPFPLTWWRPADLADVDLLTLASHGQQRLWIAILAAHGPGVHLCVQASGISRELIHQR